MSRDAVLTRAEHRVSAVEAVDRVTTGLGPPPIAGGVDVTVVGATRPLHDVAGDGGHVSQLRGRAGQDGLREYRVAIADHRVPRKLAVGDVGADADRIVTDVDSGKRGSTTPPQLWGGEDLDFHQIDERGPAGEEHRLPIGGDGCRGGIRGRGFPVAEPLHRPPSAWGGCRTAATILGYAPQRHSLPLMRSRISSSVNEVTSIDCRT